MLKTGANSCPLVLKGKALRIEAAKSIFYHSKHDIPSAKKPLTILLKLNNIIT
jgi:hypothetical protein